MTIKSVLAQANSPLFWQKHHAICFTGAEYPLRFFSALFLQLKQTNALVLPYQGIDITTHEKRQLYGLLSQSMLGSNTFFWLGNLSEERDSKAATAFKEYVSAYTGPNTIAFFIQNDQLPTVLNIPVLPLPSLIDQADFLALAAFFNTNMQRQLPIIEELFYGQKQPLTKALELVDYMSLAGTRDPEKFLAYLNLIYENEATLQQLADCFFSKQEQRFFVLWEAIQSKYPPIFWVIFWAEQLWKAIHVTRFMHQKEFIAAKKMSYRLPYAFINKYWQEVAPHELVRGHAFLYQIDYAIKTGSAFCALELFFAHYFSAYFMKGHNDDPL
jgi:hypothetical protein